MTLDGIAGKLVLRPGATPSIACERPLVGAALLDRLAQDRRAGLLPDLLATMFTLCAHAQRSTSRRAIRAALGARCGADAQDTRANALYVVRDHLQRLALDLPVLGAGAPADPHWLRDAPVMALPSATGCAAQRRLEEIDKTLPHWLQRRLFGLAPARWLERWEHDGGDWLAQWATQQDHPVARWLRCVQSESQAIAWPCRAFAPLHEGEAGLRTLAAAFDADAHFALHPTWHGEPAETGPWTRFGHEEEPRTAWERLGARLADIARFATGLPLTQGALSIAEGEGIAWTEMARGLLVHWVRLAPGAPDAASARVAHYRVLAPTDWNFHADGEFARWLARSRADAAVRLAAATLDPCLAFAIEEAVDHA